jgi:NhaP-type Na+/H+ or K+/H+ antiporter
MSLNLVLVLVLLGGWLFARVFERLRLPGVLGMIVCGLVISGVFGETAWPAGLVELEPFMKTFALVVILLRAGLGIRKSVLHRLGKTAMAMAVVPCMFEGGVLTVVLHFAMGFDWPAAGLTGFMIAAVSPAVVVPAMLRLSEQGYGHKNAVPTLVLAGASVDDVLAITLYSLFLRMAQAESVSVVRTLLELPVAVIAGVIPGILAGFGLTVWFSRRMQKIRATEKTLLLLTLSLLMVQVGDWIHSAALLGVMTVGFILLERAEAVAHELAAKLQKIWVFAEIMLFVLIGMQVDVQVGLRAGPMALAVVVAGLAARSLGVWLATMGSELSKPERLFCVMAYWPKATVQAALGSVALSLGIARGDEILALAVLSILLTAPLGLICIRTLGPKLLSLDREEFEEEPA